MIGKLLVYESNSFDPYWNLATEQLLLESVAADTCILYLWQNRNTVVIGRNQNPWAECRLSLLEADGGFLARRLSGGGAVYHDLGNLNFTFLMAASNYDLSTQQKVIQTACSYAGIPTDISGRNDLLADGKKFSGNAFYHSKGQSYHHGTLLIDTDTELLQRYLCPPKAKLESKGIPSVRSRVVNLTQLNPGLTVDAMKNHMQTAFGAVYGITPEKLTLDEDGQAVIAQLQKKHADPAFLFGHALPFSFACQDHFAWGHLRLELQAAAGQITHVALYSDAMDWTIADQVRQALTGCAFRTDHMVQCLQQTISDPQVCRDLCHMLKQQQI